MTHPNLELKSFLLDTINKNHVKICEVQAETSFITFVCYNDKNQILFQIDENKDIEIDGKSGVWNLYINSNLIVSTQVKDRITVRGFVSSKETVPTLQDILFDIIQILKKKSETLPINLAELLKSNIKSRRKIKGR